MMTAQASADATVWRLLGEPDAARMDEIVDLGVQQVERGQEADFLYWVIRGLVESNRDVMSDHPRRKRFVDQVAMEISIADLQQHGPSAV